MAVVGNAAAELLQRGGCNRGGRKLTTGTVLGRITSSGEFVAYDGGASDGREVAVGVLITAWVDAMPRRSARSRSCAGRR